MKKFITLVVLLSVLLVLQVISMTGTIAHRAETTASANVKYCSDRITDTIGKTLDLLTGLAKTDTFIEEDISYYDKSAKLTTISEQFGFMMIRIVDKDLKVYSEKSKSDDSIASDLSEREYLQTLKNTLEPQITDAFLSGSDGKTINFTVAVPIIKDEEFNGALIASIYEKDFSAFLYDNNAILVGKKLQYMSGVEPKDVGDMLDDEIDDTILFGITNEQCMLNILDVELENGYYYGINGFQTLVLAYDKVENVHWNVISKVPFNSVISEEPFLFITSLTCILLTAFLIGVTIYNREHFFYSDKEESEVLF